MNRLRTSKASGTMGLDSEEWMVVKLVIFKLATAAETSRFSPTPGPVRPATAVAASGLVSTSDSESDSEPDGERKRFRVNEN